MPIRIGQLTLNNVKYKRTDALSLWYQHRAPRRTFTDPNKPEVRPGAREVSASPTWLAAPAMNARDTTKVYILRLDTGCGPTLYRKCHSHTTPGIRHNNTWVEPLAGELYYTVQTAKRTSVIKYDLKKKINNTDNYAALKMNEQTAVKCLTWLIVSPRTHGPESKTLNSGGREKGRGLTQYYDYILYNIGKLK